MFCHGTGLKNDGNGHCKTSKNILATKVEPTVNKCSRWEQQTMDSWTAPNPPTEGPGIPATNCASGDSKDSVTRSLGFQCRLETETEMKSIQPKYQH